MPTLRSAPLGRGELGNLLLQLTKYTSVQVSSCRAKRAAKLASWAHFRSPGPIVAAVLAASN